MRPVTLNPPFTLGDFNALMARRPFDVPFVEAITLKLTYQQWAGLVVPISSSAFSFTVPACDGSGTTTYIAGDIGVDKSSLRFKASSGQSGNGNDPTSSIEVDTQSLKLIPNLNPTLPSTLAGVPLLLAMRQRAFDGAVVQRDRWFFNPDVLDARGLPIAVGGMPMFYGYVGSIDQLGRTQAVHKVKSALALLGIQMPRNLYQPNCLYTVYSSSCGAVKASFVNHGVVGSGPTDSVIPWNGGVPGSVPFANGEISMTSGPAQNQTRTIRAFDGTNLYLVYPFTTPPLVGDTFNAFPGCNRHDPLAAGSVSDCIFFSRQGSYKAAPRTPQNELGL